MPAKERKNNCENNNKYIDVSTFIISEPAKIRNKKSKDITIKSIMIIFFKKNE